MNVERIYGIRGGILSRLSPERNSLRHVSLQNSSVSPIGTIPFGPKIRFSTTSISSLNSNFRPHFSHFVDSILSYKDEGNGFKIESTDLFPEVDQCKTLLIPSLLVYMKVTEACQWIYASKNRKNVIIALDQPMTVKQICSRTGMPMGLCSYTLKELQFKGVVSCLNPNTRRSRLYWFKPLGKSCKKRLHKGLGLPDWVDDLPDIDWELYAWCCYSHRTIVIAMLTEPMQPSAIKRKARRKFGNLKMSANNVRDVIQLFKKNGIVQPVMVRKKAHPRYELTEVGRKIQGLLGKESICYRE